MVVHFLKETNELQRTSIENGNMVCRTATSEELNFGELSKTTESFPWKGWSKGDIMPNGRSKFYYSRATYGSIKSKLFELDSALKLLLTELEKDVRGVQELAIKANAQIAVTRYLYVSSYLGFQISSETIARINHLNLTLGFEQYVSGNELDEE